ncbi:MAG: carboxyl-terminal processing protease [Actinomycetota bacterium]|jgi:carboxyl-terminal processing protease|nr:carboxyl-terminal processing protease [Actinomycetota bacterium]
MEPWQKVTIAILSAITVVFAAFSVGFTMGRDDGTVRLVGTNGESIVSVQEAYNKILSEAVNPPTAKALVRGAIKGMVDVLKKNDDPYALFYTPRGYRSFQELTTGKFSGIGVWLKQKGDDLEIVSVLPDTPAQQAGLKRGDIIRSIDGDPVVEMSSDDAVSLIKGPEGSEVSLNVDRPGAEAGMSFTLTRAQIELPNLISKTIDEDLGYVRLFGFARGAGRQIHDEIQSMVDDGIKGIVLDLRDNGGGLFQEAVGVASTFIEDGEIVTYSERSKDDVVYDAQGDAFEDLPLVVLVNEGTASASEIVAGALQDRERAMIIGTTTYGKGSVQEVVPLTDSSALKLTIAAYLTPDGHDINGQGIDPDVEVDAVSSVQRARAVEILKGIVISTTGSQG